MIEAGVAALNACAGNQLPPDQAVARVYSAMWAAFVREVSEDIVEVPALPPAEVQMTPDEIKALEARRAAALAENARLSEQVSRLWAAFRRK